MPSEKEIASFYPDQYMVYEEVLPKMVSDMEMAVLKLRHGYKHLDPSFISALFAPLVSLFKYKLNMTFIKNGNILDIGCGNGKYLSKMKNLGWQSFGVEFNNLAVKACRKNHLDVFQGELKNAPFEAQEMDLVTARHVIEHIPDVNSFFDEVNKVLKLGALFHLRTPNTSALGRNFFAVNWYANDAPRHLILFSPDNLTQRAEQHGFEKVCSCTLSTPKIILNSYDYKTNNIGKPSRKKSLFRLLAKPYVFLSKLLNRGDEIYAVYRKIK
ncbi:MAG: class I SAM-dependent methyltransferase [Thiohalomonas sp.]|nr:class I SAM-dependent methyltransferase [Thiohalomonas sp.]